MGTWKDRGGTFDAIVSGRTFRVTFALNGVMAGTPAYRFDGDQLVLSGEKCEKRAGGNVEYFDCEGTYSAYVVREGDKVVAFRIEPIDDPYLDRRRDLGNTTWDLVEE